MNKTNVFKSSEFYMAEGDRLTIIIKDESGTFPQIILVGEETEVAPGAPTIDVETNVTATSFSANWFSVENADGYYLDVSTDASFEYFVAGFEDKDVSDVNTYSVTGLSEGTTYYYRVRAYNDYGASGNSGSQEVITTDVLDLIDLDGNIYTTVRIGNQEWITTNFKCKKYSDGTPIPAAVDLYLREYTDWDSHSFNVFSHSGLNISAAISDGLSPHACVINEGGTGFQPRAKVKVTISNFILNSGVAPWLVYMDTSRGDDEGYDAVYISAERISDGIFYLTDTRTNILPNIVLWNYNPILGGGYNAMNFSLDMTVEVSGWAESYAPMYEYPNFDTANEEEYGLIYSWQTVGEDPSYPKELAYLERSGVEDTGWRVPTKEDFDELVAYLGGVLIAGGKLKEAGMSHWNTPNTGADNSSGFTALGAGYEYDATPSETLKGTTIFWASTIYDEIQSYALYLQEVSAGADVDIFVTNFGGSIRLVREFPTGDVTCDRTDLTSDSLTVTSDME